MGRAPYAAPLRVLTVLLAMLVMLGLAGCGSEQSDTGTAGPTATAPPSVGDPVDEGAHDGPADDSAADDSAADDSAADDSAADDSAADDSAADDGSSDDGSGDEVVSLRLVQSGGIAGVDRVVTIRPGMPGAEQVLAAASRLDDEGTPPHTEVPCCDLFRYELTIRRADGSTVRAVTYDGDDSPAYAVVRAVQRLQAPTLGSG